MQYRQRQRRQKTLRRTKLFRSKKRAKEWSEKFVDDVIDKYFHPRRKKLVFGNYFNRIASAHNYFSRTFLY